MTVMSNSSEKKTRKTLADQIDRLDNLIAGLPDGLNEAVASALKEATTTAVQEAVRQALLEVLTNPDVLNLMASFAPMPQHAPAATEDPSQDSNSKPGLHERVGSWAGQRVAAARSACARVAVAGRKGLSGLAARLLPLWQFRRQLLTVLGLGAVVGVAVYLAGPWMATLFAGTVAVGSALAVRARLWLKRLATQLCPVTS
jgi:hypothetical protein